MRTLATRDAAFGLVALLLGPPGCQPQSISELGRGLLAPEPTQLGESRLLLAGKFSNLSTTSANDGRIWAQAIVAHSDSSEWLHVAINGSASCSFEDVVDYRLYDFDTSVWALLASDGSLRLVNDGCDVVAEPLDAAALPSGWGVPIETSAGELVWLVDDDTSDSKLSLLEVGDATTSYQSRNPPDLDRYLWTLDGGQLRQRAADGRVVREYEGEISEFATLYDGSTAFVREGDLFAHDGPDGAIALVAEDTCALSDAFQVFVHHTPCAERRLALTGPVDLDLSSGERLMVSHFYAANTISPERLGITFWRSDAGANLLRPALFYLTNADASAQTGTLMYDSGNSLAVELGSRGFIAVGSNSRKQPFVDWDGERGTAVSRASAAMNLEPEGVAGAGGALGSIAEAAITFTGPDAVPLFHDDFLLLEEQAGVGNLVRASCGAQHIIGKAVSKDSVSFDNGYFPGVEPRSVFVGNVVQDTGELFVVEDCEVTGPLASDVVADSLGSLQFPRALVYLANPRGDGTATLKAWLIEAEVEATISHGVDHFVAMPVHGVLYSVPEGERAGVWLTSPD